MNAKTLYLAKKSAGLVMIYIGWKLFVDEI